MAAIKVLNIYFFHIISCISNIFELLFELIPSKDQILYNKFDINT